MEQLQQMARELLERQQVQVIIGYEAGSEANRRRAVFVRRAEDVSRLIFDDACRQNLATYLLKPEVLVLGKIGMVVRRNTLRSLMQYAVENQLADERVIAIGIGEEGGPRLLPNFAAVEEYLAQLPRGPSAAEKAELKKMEQLVMEQRWAFWREEFDRCIKCYACRAACPLCYCNRCITEVNQPQWIPVASDALGNLEWNVIRAMHLAGRCIGCGSCADACPQGIRIDLLNGLLAREAQQQFAAEPGYGQRKDYALAVFKPDDKEEFIR
ncbi:MAG: hypothetical protein HJJLKODD_02727 [Phycisphaerae bacterium]|nr:hypothetical protein [Phycisphaerae bacterium]